MLFNIYLKEDSCLLGIDKQYIYQYTKDFVNERTAHLEGRSLVEQEEIKYMGRRSFYFKIVETDKDKIPKNELKYA